MKKLILLVIILISTISISAKTLYYKSSALAIDIVDGKGYNPYVEHVIDIAIDFDTNKITIYNKDVQVLHIKEICGTKYSDFTVIECMTTDNLYRQCVVSMFSYNNGNLYIKLEYDYIIYKYKIKRYDI